ncbi:serine hydrolase [Algoriphagus sp.]|uniref:serine hydrolase domain-containing protein n=1 Tax=Algoriphagus sp. TaxID=1872435 RepID=UPI00261CAD90|nr:serine hydrolase [Algoriphagus sp.]
MKYSLFLVVTFILFSCEMFDQEIRSSSDGQSLYFPPINSQEWERISPSELNWNQSQMDDLLEFLEGNHTRAFIILKDGKIVVEEYFGNTILGTAPFDQNSQWYWASAGKTLTATLVGIAQENGLIHLENPTANYLGSGWTSLAPEKEQLITVKNQLTMTTGLAYAIPDLNCTLPACLNYKSDAGQEWFYHNAPYTLLEKVIEQASGETLNEYTHLTLESKIGMNGQWIAQGFNTVYWSTARDMARFGLLILNKGQWNKTVVLSDQNYYQQMISSSQDLNPSYGYLWWLNGKESIVFPGNPKSFAMPLSDFAPIDLFAGMGKNGQFVEVVPSQNLVLIRMGEAPDDGLVPILFHNQMWEKLSRVMDK